MQGCFARVLVKHSSSCLCCLLYDQKDVCSTCFVSLLQWMACTLVPHSACYMPKKAAFMELKTEERIRKGKSRTWPGPACKFFSSSKDLILLFQFLVPLGNDWKCHPYCGSLSANYCFLKMRRQWLKKQGKIIITRTNSELLHFVMLSPHFSSSFLLLSPSWWITSNT